jgi:hypothetical protein
LAKGLAAVKNGDRRIRSTAANTLWIITEAGPDVSCCPLNTDRLRHPGSTGGGMIYAAPFRHHASVTKTCNKGQLWVIWTQADGKDFPMADDDRTRSEIDGHQDHRNGQDLANRKTSESEDDEKVIYISSLAEQRTEERHKPLIRQQLALGLTFVVGLAVVVSIAAAAWSANATAVRDIAVAVMPELLVVYGMVIAFSFGQQHK